jgi:peptide/nickel transport system substrate-binding protein
MTTNYWTKVLARRIGRRRALALTGGSAAAAAFLAACGSDDDGGGSTGTTGGTTGATGGGTTGGTGATGSTGGTSTGATGTSGIVTPTIDTTAQAVRGGTLKDFMNSENRSLDPINPQADLNNLIAETVQPLLTETPGKLGPGTYGLEGALAASYEVSPDGLQITFKLREGTKWHDIDPVNGREVDVDDVLYSFSRHKEQGPTGSLVWSDLGGGGFAMDAESPDGSTIVVKLTEPVAYAANWFAAFGSYTGQILMFPKEGADPNILDHRQTVIGTGPFYVSEINPSISYTLKRNPDYFDQDFAFVDEIFMPILPEYASRQSQLLAGEIHFGRAGNDIVRAEDILPLKRQNDTLLVKDAQAAASTSPMTFGYLGENQFKDERVRQAISMAFDRDLDIEVRYNVTEFEQNGMPVTRYWNTHLGARDAYVSGGWWLDPQDQATFGENAKYFHHDLEEAKTLLNAAGYPDGFEVRFSYPNAAQFDRGNIVEPYHFYLQQLGLTVVDAGLTDYTQDYIPNLRDASGNFEGIGYHSVTGTIPSVVSPTSAMVAEHIPGPVTFHGYSLDGGTGSTGDPALIEMLSKAKIERDVETRKSLVHEAQRHLAKMMWCLLEPGNANSYRLEWPAVQNYFVYQSAAANWEKYKVWLDQTKAPFV